MLVRLHEQFMAVEQMTLCCNTQEPLLYLIRSLQFMAVTMHGHYSNANAAIGGACVS